VALVGDDVVVIDAVGRLAVSGSAVALGAPGGLLAVERSEGAGGVEVRRLVEGRIVSLVVGVAGGRLVGAVAASPPSEQPVVARPALSVTLGGKGVVVWPSAGREGAAVRTHEPSAVADAVPVVDAVAVFAGGVSGTVTVAWLVGGRTVGSSTLSSIANVRRPIGVIAAARRSGRALVSNALATRIFWTAGELE
jgi:hypothetical protein